MEHKIRISSGTQKIEVNDDGEYILLPLSDDGFVMGFYQMMERIQAAAQGIQEPEDLPGKLAAVEKIVEMERQIQADVDQLFGEGTCRKVFGDILPSVDLFVEFFGAIVPFFEAYKESRMAKMGKYDAGRNGSL